MLKSIELEIKGVTPLLMHKFPMDPIRSIEKKTPQEQAEYGAYRIPDTGELYIPGIALQRALVSGATFSKGKGRASLQKPVAACLMITPEYIGLGTDEYAIDSRRVVMPATRGAIVRHRPRLDAWGGKCVLDFDDELVSEPQLREVVDNTGSRVGLLDFRPEKKGMFGRFIVTRWGG